MNFTDIRTYLKFLSRHKVYTVVSVLGFAISLTFVIVLTVYARTQVSMDSFHEKSDRIYLITHNNEAAFSNPVGEYVKDLCPEVEAFTRVVNDEYYMVGRTPQEKYRGRALFADADFFNIFSFPLLYGDPTSALLTGRSVVLSRSMARRIFGDGDPVGMPVLLDTEEFTVTGVMEDFPYNTHFAPCDIVVPYSLTTTIYGANHLESWEKSRYMIYFLARQGADLPAKTPVIREAFDKDYWIYRGGFTDDLYFMPLEDIYFAAPVQNADIKTGSVDATRIYALIAAIILVISLLNYINLTVAQVSFRGKEAAVKKLMGSSRRRIIFQMFGESLLMTSIAFVLAAALAVLSEPYFNRVFDTRLNIAAYFTLASAAATIAGVVLLSLVAGILPALTVSSFRPVEVVKGTFKRKVKTGYARVLIIFQLSVCTVLLVCTLIMRHQVQYMLTRDVGFNRENIYMMENRLEPNQIPALKDRLARIAGVDKIGLAMGSPFNYGNNSFVADNGQTVSMTVISGDSAFVDIFGLDIEPLTTAQAGEGSRVVYLNRAAFNAVEPDPGTYRFGGWRDDAVVGGILGDVNVESLRYFVDPTMFFYADEGNWPWEIVVKISSDDAYATARAVRREYADIVGDENSPTYFADQRIEEWYREEKHMLRIMGTFSVLSIVIMVMGVFAMSLYMIRQKEKEIGLRKVSGATVGQVLAMLNRQSLSRVAIAFAIACPLAWYGVSRWLQNFAYRIDPGAWAFVIAGALVAILCLASVSWQSWRAARANPVESLKSE